MKLILDVENTTTKRDDKLHLDPFEPNNSLVMVGMIPVHFYDRTCIYTLDHSEVEPTKDAHEKIQITLNETTLLIGHNIAYDLLWLWESGFKYDGPVFDTMLNDYVLQRGRKEPLSLEACAERYELETKKQSTLKDYFSKGYSTRDIPHKELSEYLSADLFATRDLYNNIMEKYGLPENKGLRDTAMLTDQVAVCLARIYQRGFAVDKSVLESVRKEFVLEKQELDKKLNQIVRAVMGDFPINLNSPEQLSWVLYSRKPKDKAMWGNMFEPRMDIGEYKELVKTHSDVLYKQTAKQCPNCKGYGTYYKKKKNGSPFAKPSKCPECKGIGYVFSPTLLNGVPVVAGLKFATPNATWVTANGFSTNKLQLEKLEMVSLEKSMQVAKTFISGIKRLSALDTYLSSFIDGISTHTKVDGKLHVRLLQHRTATGRFSGADPNMQNMPRGGTFPVKKVFVSRWEGGQILEADFAQLEFRVAAYLSQDKVAMKEIATGFDVHSYTAKIISDAGQPTSRQVAKMHTFAPLYGASGYGRTQSEATYYKHFVSKYNGIKKWHDSLAKEAVNCGKITTPSGRQFSFPDVVRRSNGSVTYFTQIKNYPVQSFATADIVPLALLHIDKLLDDCKSCVVNTVHDSIVIDVHPEEREKVLSVIKNTNDNLKELIDSRWNIDFNVPLLLEAKIGKNWLDTKDVV